MLDFSVLNLGSKMKKYALFLAVAISLISPARADYPASFREKYYRSYKCMPVEELEQIYRDSFTRHGFLYSNKEIIKGIETNIDLQNIELVFYLDVKIEDNLGLGVIVITITSIDKCVRYFSPINSRLDLTVASILRNKPEFIEMNHLFQTKLKLVEQDFENWVDKSKDTYFISKE